MATVSVSYLWIALEVRGAQERAAGEAIFLVATASWFIDLQLTDWLRSSWASNGCQGDDFEFHAH